jgi:hypothetical protein
MIHCIRHSQTPNIFSIYWKTPDGKVIPDSELTLDFNPILECLGFTGSFCLLHYQAKPKFLRRFGVYCNGFYFSTNQTIASSCTSLAVVLDESKLILPPNAVIAYPNSVYNPTSNIILPHPN